MKDSNQIKKILLIGIGNDGRTDDAMGWKFLDQFSDLNDIFDFEYRYQLQIEDAELISQYNTVIFVDASQEQFENGFYFYPCIPASSFTLTTHQLAPEVVLWLAGSVFDAPPKGYVLAISGINWKLGYSLSKGAKTNFKNAVTFFQKKLGSIGQILYDSNVPLPTQ